MLLFRCFCLVLGGTTIIDVVSSSYQTSSSNQEKDEDLKNLTKASCLMAKITRSLCQKTSPSCSVEEISEKLEEFRSLSSALELSSLCLMCDSSSVEFEMRKKVEEFVSSEKGYLLSLPTRIIEFCAGFRGFIYHCEIILFWHSNRDVKQQKGLQSLFGFFSLPSMVFMF